MFSLFLEKESLSQLFSEMFTALTCEVGFPPKKQYLLYKHYYYDHYHHFDYSVDNHTALCYLNMWMTMCKTHIKPFKDQTFRSISLPNTGIPQLHPWTDDHLFKQADNRNPGPSPRMATWAVKYEIPHTEASTLNPSFSFVCKLSLAVPRTVPTRGVRDIWIEDVPIISTCRMRPDRQMKARRREWFSPVVRPPIATCGGVGLRGWCPLVGSAGAVHGPVVLPSFFQGIKDSSGLGLI